MERQVTAYQIAYNFDDFFYICPSILICMCFQAFILNPKCEYYVRRKGDVVVFFILEHTITYGSVFHSAKFPMPFHEKYVRTRSRHTCICNYMNMNYRNLIRQLLF